MKKIEEVLTLDLDDYAIITDEATLFNLQGIHKILQRMRDANRIGLEYTGIEEDKDIKGIIYLHFKNEK